MGGRSVIHVMVGVALLPVAYPDDPDFINELSAVFDVVPGNWSRPSEGVVANAALKSRLRGFVARYVERFPELHDLLIRVEGLGVGRHFLLIFREIESSLERFKYEQCLAGLNGEPPIAAASAEVMDAFEQLLQKFDECHLPGKTAGETALPNIG